MFVFGHSLLASALPWIASSTVLTCSYLMATRTENHPPSDTVLAARLASSRLPNALETPCSGSVWLTRKQRYGSVWPTRITLRDERYSPSRSTLRLTPQHGAV